MVGLFQNCFVGEFSVECWCDFWCNTFRTNDYRGENKMYITKSLAIPNLDKSDCIKIVNLSDYDGDSIVYRTLKDIIRLADFDITDDELLAHICIRAGLFTYKEWQLLINDWVKKVTEIDYKVDSTQRRLNTIETIYQMSGECGRVLAGGYKMISALTVRELIGNRIQSFESHFGGNPRDYIVKVWQELDRLLNDGIIIGEYTHELHFVKYHK